MSTVIRDFKDFRSFPGKINNHGIYKFPTIYSKDSMGRIRYWDLTVRLVKDKGLEYEHDWDTTNETIYKITDKLYDSANEVPDGIIAQIYNKQGIINGKEALHPPTVVREGSIGLKGKANARNTFTQALINARSQYQKKIDTGYSLDKNVIKDNSRHFAMAAHTYADEVKRGNLTFPCWSQPKLDGVRCIMTMENNKIAKYSRDLNDWLGYDYLDKYLKDAFSMYDGLHLDGELYLHGKRLQEITGVARNEKKKFKLQYHIFDLFITSDDGPNLTWTERYDILKELFEDINTDDIVLVKAKKCNNQMELDQLYKQYIDDGYEGQMIRLDSIYSISTDRERRSHDLIKRKKVFDDEYKLVDYTKGTKGRALGTFIGIFETIDGKRFRASPKDMSMDEMKELYNNIKANPGAYINRFATIEYQDLSKLNVPLRPKFKAFRDIK